MSGYTDESLNSDTRLSRASPAALCSMASSWVSMGLAVTLCVTRTQLMVTRAPVMMGEVSMVMCTEILMPLATHHTSFIRSQAPCLTRCICGHRAALDPSPSLHPAAAADKTTWFFRRIIMLDIIVITYPVRTSVFLRFLQFMIVVNGD